MTESRSSAGFQFADDGLPNASEFFGDDVYDAIRDAIRALGGAKVVGHRLRPEKSVDAAERWLLDCVNPHRHEKLDPEQVLLIARWACEAGHHGLIAFVCRSAGYTLPQPRALSDQLAEAQLKAIAAQRKAEQAAQDLRTLIDNPRLVAAMRAAGINVEAMS